MLFPIAWSLILLLFLAWTDVVPVASRVVISIVTIGAFVVLARSHRGWHRLLTLPLGLLLAILLYATWAHPIWTMADFDRARNEKEWEKVNRNLRDPMPRALLRGNKNL
jgi:hypothetical protein